jgi:hypothetical protein
LLGLLLLNGSGLLLLLSLSLHLSFGLGLCLFLDAGTSSDLSSLLLFHLHLSFLLSGSFIFRLSLSLTTFLISSHGLGDLLRSVALSLKSG